MKAKGTFGFVVLVATLVVGGHGAMADMPAYPHDLVSDASQAQAESCTLDQGIEVLWNGTWYAATIKAGPNAQGQCQIGYDGWDSSWDEWVGADRMRPRPQIQPPSCVLNEGIEVLWNGTWYAATIKAGPNTQGQCQIGYDGWDSSWDEWVGADRMRPRAAQ